ncbi:hypothetical protein ASG47_17075 [Devosia sp. Leaf420]|uniref:DUF1624 domain-containing protein n=1 Tax=Devosia sp. Leaf420 TaxID=1736374 RepID=UPI000713CB27|nr:heparan-alpha-glucosaminide N-acetyltransferase [Devosia sp. Leaf420]KQT44268.1 hypothetical protein ASG47_17075 [Devosia sp. Leaf420]
MSDVSIKKPRLPVIDIARGVAILFMAFYHLCWDLWYFGFIGADVGFDPRWVFFARSILASFLFLVGVGLVLGHGNGIRWQSFWRRWLFVAVGALAITLGTYFTFPDAFVYFGVLHAIALFMLMGLPFLFVPLWAVGLVALLFIVPHFVFADPLFNEKIFSWLGFWVTPPVTNDLVPVFPWFGAVLVGILATRLAKARVLPKLAEVQPQGKVPRALGWLGRWSLPFYLIHQPVLLAAIVPLSMLLGTQDALREADFLKTCQATCETGGTSAEMCTTYCQCGMEGLTRDNLWDPVYSGVLTADEQAKLDENNRQCSAVIYPELLDGDAVPESSSGLDAAPSP